MKRAISAAALLLYVAAAAQYKKISLDSKNVEWRIKAQDEVQDDAMMKAGYDASGWVEATVPGTVFGAYVEAGLEKDPNFGDNAYRVDKRKYDRNFWYRATFRPPVLKPGEVLWLNFEGVNRRAAIYLNGRELGRTDGFMQRGRFPVNVAIDPGVDNVLAVMVEFPGRPIPNLASPTYISADGWDWMPPVPGLLSGITDNVYMTVSRQVSLENPWVRTVSLAGGKAQLSLQVELKNVSGKKQRGVLQGVIQPGGITFEREIIVEASSCGRSDFGHGEIKELEIENPALWWPNGYGAPNLYTMELNYIVDGQLSDTRTVAFGIRRYSYEKADGVFRILCNGRPIFCKGGNWGMSEWLLRCRGEEYDLKVMLHKHMHFNIIRNWIGSTTDEEFYDACDRHGIMVWDDFWLNSHKNLPRDVQCFNDNAIEKVKRLRNHPCIAVWCGDNEGYPLPPLDSMLRSCVAACDGNDRWYQPNSNSDGLSGSGVWANNHPSWYFLKNPLGFGENIVKGHGFRTEIGTAVFTSFESFRKFMPEESWWPRNEMWDRHFFGKSAANASPDKYFSTVEHNYGQAEGIEDFCRKAQLVNYEVSRAMYEGWQHNIWRDATGIMTWMSQPAYPSLVWQTYDYYYDLTGAYWGARKACEPLHIQWSHADNSVKAVNATLQDAGPLRAEAIVYNMDGSEVSRLQAFVTAAANDATQCFVLDFPSDNMALKKTASASSVSRDAAGADAVTDGSEASRWSSEYADDQWIAVDLGQPREIASVQLAWEAAHARSYRLSVSADARSWKEVWAEDNCKGGTERISFRPVTARYVRMQGVKRATQWGFSLFEFEVYGKKRMKNPLTPVHFIRLRLTGKTGETLSENFYWRALRTGDYKALSDMPKANLKVNNGITTSADKKTKTIKAVVVNTGKHPAFAVHVQLVRRSDGERILPAIPSDNYFTLMPGESKSVEIAFRSALLPPDDNYILQAVPYNDR